jgi:hypothetical protein
MGTEVHHKVHHNNATRPVSAVHTNKVEGGPATAASQPSLLSQAFGGGCAIWRFVTLHAMTMCVCRHMSDGYSMRAGGTIAFSGGADVLCCWLCSPVYEMPTIAIRRTIAMTGTARTVHSYHDRHICPLSRAHLAHLILISLSDS